MALSTFSGHPAFLVLLFANLKNIYIILMLVTTIWLGIIGFLDDFIKVFSILSTSLIPLLTISNFLAFPLNP